MHSTGTLTRFVLAAGMACGLPTLMAIGEPRLADSHPGTPRSVNHAHGKPVTGQDGASHGKGLSQHVTDGDYETHAKPPASRFSYVIHLAKEPADQVRLHGVRVVWGEFGDYFRGIRKANGQWASAAWAGEYVKHYRISYQKCADGPWHLLHEWKGRPAEETGPGVNIQKGPPTREGTSSHVTTELAIPETGPVHALRIQGWGEHWIGLYELEAWGPPVWPR